MAMCHANMSEMLGSSKATKLGVVSGWKVSCACLLTVP